MKKVININFQGRIIPIEESAYEELKVYTDSLRRYFAREEGRDEIINDIENRIAELFSERLKKDPAGCVTDGDVNEVIASIGRPEDFDDMGLEKEASTAGSQEQQQHQQQQTTTQSGYEPRGSLFRNDNDRILGGVCSGLAHYLRIDPTIVRILFALITFGGFGLGFLLYIVLWIVLPAKGLQHNIRRRLYRNPDGKVIGGVCGGIASYFNIPVWIPRLVFALPFFISILTNIFNGWGGFDPFPDIVFGSFGGTLVVAYIILWIVVPFASTASEKLEMRGEKVDLESIKQSVQEELQSGKGRTEKAANEFKAKMEKWGEEVKERGQAFAAEAKRGSGVGHAIGVLFKAFFLFVAGIIVFALFVALMALIFSGIGIFPLKNYILEGFWQNFLAWGTLVLFLGIPIIAAVVWLIRRIAGIRSKSNYLGYAFGSLWTIGIVCAVFLAAMISRQFKRQGNIKEEVSIAQPTQGRMIVDVADVPGRFYNMVWFNDEHDDFPALSADEDSMLLNTVRIRITKSSDSNFHTYSVKFARGNTPVIAEQTAGKISFPVKQSDSIVYLPKGFSISKDSKFRNQQVLFVVEVPVGKKIKIDRNTNRFSWFSINTNRRGLNIDWDNDWDDSYSWHDDVWYVMTDKGLERVEKEKLGNEEQGENKGGEYRYKGDTINIKLEKKDTTVNIKLRTESENNSREEQQSTTGDVNKEGYETGGTRQVTISALDVLKLGGW